MLLNSPKVNPQPLFAEESVPGQAGTLGFLAEPSLPIFWFIGGGPHHTLLERTPRCQDTSQKHPAQSVVTERHVTSVMLPPLEGMLTMYRALCAGRFRFTAYVILTAGWADCYIPIWVTRTLRLREIKLSKWIQNLSPHLFDSKAVKSHILLPPHIKNIYQLLKNIECCEKGVQLDPQGGSH